MAYFGGEKFIKGKSAVSETQNQLQVVAYDYFAVCQILVDVLRFVPSHILPRDDKHEGSDVDRRLDCLFCVSNRSIPSPQQ